MREARRDPAFEITRSWELPDIPVHPDDESLTDYLKRVGFSDDQIQYTRRSWANAACEAPEDLSAYASLQEMHDTSAGSGDYRILQGYDVLINHVARDLDIRLNTIVHRIEWDDQGVRVQTSTGEFIADQAVIALPLGVLQAGSVEFVPALPAEKQHAIQHLIMGLAIKLVYRFASPVLPDGIEALYSDRNPPMWWSPSQGQNTQEQVITAFATGDWARELLAMGEQGALDYALASLSAELGRDLQPIDRRLMDWSAEPFTRGGYSAAPVGGEGLRALLAQPISNRLFWAGEATAFNPWASTVHGAYATGKRAAKEVLEHVLRT